MFITFTVLHFWAVDDFSPAAGTALSMMGFLSLFELAIRRGWSGGSWATGSAFIYFSHFYGVRIFKYAIVYLASPQSTTSIVLATIVTTILSVVLCHSIQLVGKCYFPKVFAFITGGRV